MSGIFDVLVKGYSAANKRYVNRFLAVSNPIKPGRSTVETEAEKKAYLELQESADHYKKAVEKYPIIKEIKETLCLIVKDLDDLQFIIEIADGEAHVSVRSNKDKQPTFIIPLYAKNISNLKATLADDSIDMSEVYRYIRVLFIPFLRGLYQTDYSYLPKDKSYMQLDNFIHVEVKPDTDIEVDGFPGPAQAPVVNVDGQWLIFEGFQGDPDVKYSMNVIQALEFAYLIRVKLIQADPSIGSWSKLTPIVDQYNELKKKVLVYERKWHNVEEL